MKIKEVSRVDKTVRSSPFTFTVPDLAIYHCTELNCTIDIRLSQKNLQDGIKSGETLT